MVLLPGARLALRAVTTLWQPHSRQTLETGYGVLVVRERPPVLNVEAQNVEKGIEQRLEVFAVLLIRCQSCAVGCCRLRYQPFAVDFQQSAGRLGSHELVLHVEVGLLDPGFIVAAGSVESLYCLG